MIFWIYVNNTKQHLVSETDETLYIFKLFNVKIFWKKKKKKKIRQTTMKGIS